MKELKEAIKIARKAAEPVWLAVYGNWFISLEDLLEHFSSEQIMNADKSVLMLDGIPYVPSNNKED